MNEQTIALQEQIVSLVEKFERRIEQLEGACSNAQKKAAQLEKQNKTLRQRIRERQEKIKRLQEKQVNSEKNVSKSKELGKIVINNLSGTDTKTELKQQLDEYIRELERCIAHLSSLS